MMRGTVADVSRREFTALAVTAAAAPLMGARQTSVGLSAAAVIERIKKNIGVEWKLDSIDGIKAGDPSTAATGIVTTSMATLAVLQQAVKAGASMIVTAQPTFYGRADVPTPPAGRGGATAAAPLSDRIFTAKNEFITRNHLVVFRLSEHWRLRRPDPFAQGIGTALRWSQYRTAGDPYIFDVPEVSLDVLAANVKRAFQSRGGIRAMGDPRARVRRVGLLPGTTPIQSALKMLPNVDAIIAGEVREWESVEYVRDKVCSGEKKGLILLGRVVSEEPGMNICADWLKTVVSEVAVRHIPAGDPYWRPS